MKPGITADGGRRLGLFIALWAVAAVATGCADTLTTSTEDARGEVDTVENIEYNDDGELDV